MNDLMWKEIISVCIPRDIAEKRIKKWHLIIQELEKNGSYCFNPIVLEVKENMPGYNMVMNSKFLDEEDNMAKVIVKTSSNHIKPFANAIFFREDEENYIIIGKIGEIYLYNYEWKCRIKLASYLKKKKESKYDLLLPVKNRRNFRC